MQNIINGFDFGALSIVTTYVGKVDDKEWQHYLWSVQIKHKDGFFVTPYKCGLGHVELKHPRMTMPKLSNGLPAYKKGTIAYQEWHEASHQPKKPSNSDIMNSLLMDSDAGEMSFNDWCGDYGYDNDSMKAFKMYQACCEAAVNIRKCFSTAQINEMRLALEDY